MEIEKNGKTSSEWHYYISSAELTADELLKHAVWSGRSKVCTGFWMFISPKIKQWFGIWTVQQSLNIMRKIALNLAREYKLQRLPKSPISGILKRNLFDVNNLAAFLQFFFALLHVTPLLPN